MKTRIPIILMISLLGFTETRAQSLAEQASQCMEKATRFFHTQVATQGGYLWVYSPDLSLRQGELPASDTTIWVQPPGTPTVGMAYLEAYEATRGIQYLNAALDAAHALAWGQLASGGWDHMIDFHHSNSEKWYYRRDLDAGDLEPDKRRNRTYFDDDITQSALRFLMRIDKITQFEHSDIHRAVSFGLEAILKTQYPNGGWPQRYDTLHDPAQFPIKPARYPTAWSRTHPKTKYFAYYTLNDNVTVDLIATLLEAAHTFDNTSYLDAAKKGGDFLILAQMPEPQPAWAQQYNAQMEPAWARRFEPPAITGNESINAVQALLDLYVETGEKRFLGPVSRALEWANRSLLPDDQLARFYELQTNTPLYFTQDYELTYSDSNVPDHYSFKVSSSRLKRVEAYYQRIQTENRQELLQARQAPRAGASRERVTKIIADLDDQGRWIGQGRIKNPANPKQRIQAEIISSNTFSRNLTTLARYVASKN